MSSIPLNSFLAANSNPNSLENILQMNKQSIDYYLPKDNSVFSSAQNPFNFAMNPLAQLAFQLQKQNALVNPSLQRPLLNFLNSQTKPVNPTQSLLNLLSLNTLANTQLSRSEDSKPSLLTSSSDSGFHVKNKNSPSSIIHRPITVLAKPEPDVSTRADDISKDSTSETSKDSPQIDSKSKKIFKKSEPRAGSDKVRSQPKRNPAEIKTDDSNRFEIILGRMDEVVSIVGYDNIDKKKLYVIYERSDKNVKKFFIKLKRNLYYYRKTLRTDSSEI